MISKPFQEEWQLYLSDERGWDLHLQDAGNVHGIRLS